MTAAAVFSLLSDSFAVRSVYPYLSGWRVYVYSFPVTSDRAIAARVRKAGLQFAGRGWSAEKGQYMVVTHGT